MVIYGGKIIISDWGLLILVIFRIIIVSRNLIKSIIILVLENIILNQRKILFEENNYKAIEKIDSVLRNKNSTNINNFIKLIEENKILSQEIENKKNEVIKSQVLFKEYSRKIVFLKNILDNQSDD